MSQRSNGLTALLLPALLSACANSESGGGTLSQYKVIGGDREGSEPAALMLELNGSLICTATLIAPKVALTAGHCVSYQGLHVPQSASIVENGVKVATSQVVDYVYHPDWTGDLNTGMDIALLYLSDELPTAPIAIDGLSASQRVGSVGKIVGYGQTVSRDPGSAGEKHSVALELVEVIGANANILTLRSPDGVYRSSCKGDSGGPFFIGEGAQRVVSGVTSFGTGPSADDPCTGDSYYTSVAYHAAWIQDHLNGSGNPDPNDPNQGGGQGGAWGGGGGQGGAWGGGGGQGGAWGGGGGQGGAWGGGGQGGAWGGGGQGGAWGGGGQGGAGSCGEIFMCFEGCQDERCAEGCYQSATAAAQAGYDALWMCNDQMGCGWYEDCLWYLCGQELQGCF